MQLVYVSPVPWFSFAQRPHKFVEWFVSRFAGDVLWIDPYPTRLPVLADFLTTQQRPIKSELPSWLTIVRPRALPIEPLWGARWLNGLFWQKILQEVGTFLAQGTSVIVIGKPSELAVQILTICPDIKSVYDAMDDFPAFYHGLSKASMFQQEQHLVSLVSHILASSTVLLQRFTAYNPILTLNACAVDKLPLLQQAAQKINPQTIVLGYVGTIGYWFDWEMVFKLALANPTATIRLIGPVHQLPPKPLLNNIELLPACDHAAAICAMQDFSAGLIPFKKIQLTASVDPIKYYEYYALGLAVISTSFGEMALRAKQEGVFLIDDTSDLVSVLEKALAYKCQLEQIQQFRRLNSWEARFDACDIFR